MEQKRKDEEEAGNLLRLNPCVPPGVFLQEVAAEASSENELWSVSSESSDERHALNVVAHGWPAEWHILGRICI